MERVIRNRKVYCKIHHCDLIVGNNLIDKSRPTAWSKLLVAKRYLPRYDYLFYLDMDMVIMNMSKSIVDYISYARALEATKPGDSYDFIMPQDWSGPNTGAWLVRNSSWSVQFLSDAWTLGHDMVKPRTPDGKKKYPFQYEQRVFHYMLDTDVWKSRKLPTYPKTTEVNQHFLILPQCALNSYSIHPLEYRANREVSQYVPGDFLIHFPGKAPKNKLDLMSHYLSIVEKDPHYGAI